MTVCRRVIAVFFAVALFITSPLLYAARATAENYRPAVDRIVTDLNARNTESFDHSLDADYMLDTVLDDLLLDPEWKKGFRAGLRKAITTKLGTKIIEQMPAEAYAKLLRIKVSDDMGLALVRFDYGDNGSGYMDMHLRLTGDGKLRIIDWYDYSTGQNYTDSLRQATATLSPTPTVLGKVFDLATNRKDNADTLTELIHMNKSGQHEAMARKFLTLNEGLRKSRLLNIIAVQASNMTNDLELYGKVLANVEHYYSDDETMAFVLLDYYFLTGRYDKVLHAADQLQASFGTEDAGLIVIKANTLVEQGKYREAGEQARHAIELEPEYEYAYWALISTQLQQKKFAQATETAAVLEDNFDYDMGPSSLSSNETYTEFLKSAEYQSWRKGR